MSTTSSPVRTAATVIALVSLIGCRSTKSSPSAVSTVAPAQSTAFVAKGFASVQPNDPDLAAYMPDEEKASNSVDEYRPQARSFGGTLSSGYSAGGGSPSGCPGGCSH